jgi:hypothetical protein
MHFSPNRRGSRAPLLFQGRRPRGPKGAPKALDHETKRRIRRDRTLANQLPNRPSIGGIQRSIVSKFSEHKFLIIRTSLPKRAHVGKNASYAREQGVILVRPFLDLRP